MGSSVFDKKYDIMKNRHQIYCGKINIIVMFIIEGNKIWKS